MAADAGDGSAEGAHAVPGGQDRKAEQDQEQVLQETPQKTEKKGKRKGTRRTSSTLK